MKIREQLTIAALGVFCCMTAGMLAGRGGPAFAQEPKSDGGSIFPTVRGIADSSPLSLSWLSRDWPDIEQWRISGRAKMQELLCYETNAVEPGEEILAVEKRDGHTRYHVRYHVTPHQTTEAFLLVPDGLDGPAPAVLALHDHGGFYYYGKEKHTATDDPPEPLENHIERAYGGRTYAGELVKRGFVVLCPDAFYFGSRRIDPATVSARIAERHPDMFADDPSVAIPAFNRFAGEQEALTAKMIFTAGSTWPGILFQGDRASVDYLLTRPEVDPGRIGCMGLSIGGFRSAHLFGLDPRLKAAVVAGWMCAYDSLLFDDLLWHTWMIYVPRQYRYLDLPDVASLNAPCPLMVINCERDTLFPMEGMRAAETKLSRIYQSIGAGERFLCRYYDVPHSLNVEMQDDAIDWLARWLEP